MAYSDKVSETIVMNQNPTSTLETINLELKSDDSKITNRSMSVYFPDLDGWRFVAFFVVFVAHTSRTLPDLIYFGPELKWLSIPLARMFQLGDAGVAFFFVLSGFLITYLLLEETRQTGRFSIGFFYVRRTLRIWPLYFAVLTFGFVIYPAIKNATSASESINIESQWYYWIFLSNFDVMKIPAGEGVMMTFVTWSVAVEEQFYLVWPLLFIIIPRRYYGAIFPLIIAGVLIFRAFNLENDRLLYFHTFSVVGDLALGGWLAFLSINSKRFVEMIRNIRGSYIIGVYTLGILLLLYQSVWDREWQLLSVFSRLILASFFGFIILEQNYCKNSPFKMSGYSWLTRWGRYTYGLYLLHPIAIQFFLVACKKMNVNPNTIAVVLSTGTCSFFLSLGMAYASYIWFESWFLKLKNRFRLIEFR